MVPRRTSFFSLIASFALVFTLVPTAELFASIGGTPQPQKGVASKVPAQKKSAAQAAPLAEMPAWLNDYADALEKAKAGQKMLLVHFCQPNNTNCAAIERSLTNPRVRHRVQNYVLARVGTDATISQEGQKVRLLEHSSFSELHGGPGLAVIDLAHKKQPYYGRVVTHIAGVVGWDVSIPPRPRPDIAGSTRRNANSTHDDLRSPHPSGTTCQHARRSRPGVNRRGREPFHASSADSKSGTPSMGKPVFTDHRPTLRVWRPCRNRRRELAGAGPHRCLHRLHPELAAVLRSLAKRPDTSR